MSDDQRDLITICITAYRRPSFLVQSLLSCLTQEYRPLDIDISDDSPNSDAQTAIRLLNVPEGITLRYRRNSPSLGEPSNVNSLFAEARGRRLVLLHDDDMLVEGAVSALSEAFKMDARVIASFGFQQVLSCEGEVQEEASEALNRHFYRGTGFAGVIRDPLVSALRRQFPNNGYLVNSDLAREVGYRLHDEIGRAGDTDFAIRLAQQCKDSFFVLVPQVTSCIRRTPNSSGTLPGVAWKLYQSLKALTHLTPEQCSAREELESRLQSRALVDYAIYGQRREALRIFLSRSYLQQSSLSQALYHLSLILAPRVQSWALAIRQVSSADRGHPG